MSGRTDATTTNVKCCWRSLTQRGSRRRSIGVSLIKVGVQRLRWIRAQFGSKCAEHRILPPRCQQAPYKLGHQNTGRGLRIDRRLGQAVSPFGAIWCLPWSENVRSRPPRSLPQVLNNSIAVARRKRAGCPSLPPFGSDRRLSNDRWTMDQSVRASIETSKRGSGGHSSILRTATIAVAATGSMTLKADRKSVADLPLIRRRFA